MNRLSFCLILTFGTGCSLGELSVNLWSGDPGKTAFSEHCHISSGAGGQVIGCGKFYLFVMNVSEGQTVDLLLQGVFPHSA